MLVCGKCYGSQEDLELSRIIKQAKIIRSEEDAYLDVIVGMVESIKMQIRHRGERS
jgi:hypothetical protein